MNNARAGRLLCDGVRAQRPSGRPAPVRHPQHEAQQARGAAEDQAHDGRGGRVQVQRGRRQGHLRRGPRQRVRRLTLMLNVDHRNRSVFLMIYIQNLFKNCFIQ